MKGITQIVFVLLALVIFVSQGHAQQRVFSEYEYDEVGNITSRVQDISGSVPSISQVSPSIVRRNQTLLVTLIGTGLRGARLGEQNGFFSFSDINSTDEELSFTLSVADNADQGTSQVSVTTSLGTAVFDLNILTELPDLRISPTPLTLALDSVKALNVSLSATDVLNHSVSVSIADTSIATVSASQINFTQGSLSASEP